MRKLKYILQSKYLFKVLALVFLFGAILFNNIYTYKSKYSGSETKFIGVVTKFELRDNKLIIELKSNEKLIVNYRYKDEIFNDLCYGDKIKVEGILTEPSVSSIPNTFNYKKYLYNKKIYYIVEATSIEKIENNTSYLYTIKNILYKKINNLKSSGYIKTLLLGDNTLSSEVNNSYRVNGISHLFSISGMHIMLITNLLLFYLNKITYTKKIKYVIVDIFLVLYYILVGTSSLLRSVIMNILSSINYIFKLKINKLDILCITLIIAIIINPFIIYDIGFIYSYIISLFLIMFSYKSNNKLYKIVGTAVISFVVSLPITIYNSYEINVISIVMNIILVPIISIIIFLLCFLTVIFPMLDNILYFIINVFEKLSIFISEISITKFIFPKPNILIVILCYIIIFIVLKKKKYFYVLFLVIIVHYFSPYFDSNLELMMFDVEEADSILVSYPYNGINILIDTGRNEYTMKNGIIPYLKSKGIRKIDFLVITHGDLDHIGGAVSLISNFKVENIILNKGEYSDLEIELINNITNENLIKDIDKIDNNIYFLNNKIYDNENDNSCVMYFEYLRYKFLFMGDSSFVVEDYLLENYNLKDISFLKVGHHGSSTSTTKEFIDIIKPKISMISVGKNNRYGHPNDEVLDNLKNSRVYRTDKLGSINFEIYKNKVRIKNYIEGG